MIIKKLLVLIIALLTCSVLAGNNAELKKHEIKIIKNISYLSKATKDKYREKMSVLDIYLPKGAKNFPTLVYFHGGGMTGQVNNFESGKNKKINLANSKEPSHIKRFHYPLFNISACKK